MAPLSIVGNLFAWMTIAVFLLIADWNPPHAAAQDPPPASRIQENPLATGGMETVPSVSTPIQRSASQQSPSPQNRSQQIKVSFRQIQIPSSLRRQIYQSFNVNSQQSFDPEVQGLDHVDKSVDRAKPSAFGVQTPIGGFQSSTIQTNQYSFTNQIQIVPVSSRMSCFDVQHAAVAKLLEKLTDAGAADQWLPSVIALDGDIASLDSRESRPFVMSFEIKKGSAVPVVRQIATGNQVQVRVQANHDGTYQTDLTWVNSRITAVETDDLFLAGFEPLKIQVPTRQRRITQHTDLGTAGRWIWMDPHWKANAEVPKSKPKSKSIASRLASWNRPKPKVEEESYLVLLAKVEPVPEMESGRFAKSKVKE